MPQLYVQISLDHAAAIAAGETRAGHMGLPLTTAILEPLSPDERTDLARSCTEDESGNGLYYRDRLRVLGTSPDAIAAAVRERIAERRAEEAAAAEKKRAIDALFAGPRDGRLERDETRLPGRQWDVRRIAREIVGYSDSAGDAKLREEARAANAADREAHDARLLDEPVEQHAVQGAGGAWSVREDVADRWWYGSTWHLSYPRAHARALAIAEERNAAAAAAERAMYETVLRDALTAEQWERYEAGVLPTAERDDAMREMLFAGADLPVYAPLTNGDLEHDEDCNDPRARYDVAKHSSIDALALTAEQFATVKRIRAAFERLPKHASAVELQYREHRASCGDCTAEDVTRLGARVQLRVNGRTYSREFAV